MKVILFSLVVGTLSTPAKEPEKRLKSVLRHRLLNHKKLSRYIPAESSKKLSRCEESC